jgi:hypothetical protein
MLRSRDALDRRGPFTRGSSTTLLREGWLAVGFRTIWVRLYDDAILLTFADEAAHVPQAGHRLLMVPHNVTTAQDVLTLRVEPGAFLQLRAADANDAAAWADAAAQLGHSDPRSPRQLREENGSLLSHSDRLTASSTGPSSPIATSSPSPPDKPPKPRKASPKRSPILLNSSWTAYRPAPAPAQSPPPPSRPLPPTPPPASPSEHSEVSSGCRGAAVSQSTPLCAVASLDAVASLEAECASLARAASRLPSTLEAAQQAGLEEGAAREAVNRLQRMISSSMKLSQAVEKSLAHVKKSGNASSRAGYLLTLFDQIGPPPCGRSWRDEW